VVEDRKRSRGAGEGQIRSVSRMAEGKAMGRFRSAGRETEVATWGRMAAVGFDFGFGRTLGG
jgi:hypothetical protein